MRITLMLKSLSRVLTTGLLAVAVAAGTPGAAASSDPDPPGDPSRHEVEASATRSLAMRAFGHFRDGLATGQWDPWIALLADDFTFFFPMGKYHGLHEGKAKAAEFFAYVRSVYPDGLTLTLDLVTVDANRAIFEFRSEGTLVLPTERRAYRNRVAVAMEFRDGQVAAYREYFGSDGRSY